MEKDFECSGYRAEDFQETVELNLDNKAVCGYCGRVVDQGGGFANAERGFYCFECISKTWK